MSKIAAIHWKMYFEHSALQVCVCIICCIHCTRFALHWPAGHTAAGHTTTLIVLCSVPLQCVVYPCTLCATVWTVPCTLSAPAVWGSPAARTIPCFPAHFVRLPLRLSPLLHPTYTCCILREREKMRKKDSQRFASKLWVPPLNARKPRFFS